MRAMFNALFLLVIAGGGVIQSQVISGSVRHEQERLRKQERRANEVTLGTQVWSYQRIYPLLDGLFQDVAATQLSALTLNPNSANGTNLDAVQQSFQLQAQYSQLAGIQNAAAAQTTQATSAYQTQLVLEQGRLVQAALTAQAQQGRAQAAFDTISTSATATPDQVAAAKQTLAAAMDNVNAINSQLTTMKDLNPAPTPLTAATGTLTTAPTAPTALPAALLTNALTGTPSLPATKQMDNQIGLLWERLSRLVGAMTKADSMYASTIYLVKFDTGLNPIDRKNQLLDTDYSLACASGGEPPTVVDLFPRVSAVNLNNVKYKDTSFGLSALVSFFSVGLSAAYNREHLRATQLLGQNSYITGHGIGSSNFGWLFGITMGEDTIAPGERSTFALVAVPPDCKGPVVKLKSANWSKYPFSGAKMPDVQLSDKATQACDDCIASIQFNRAEYDPTAGKPASVMIMIELKTDMDQQMSVTANGIYMKRARDNFGRGIGSGGSAGLLETTSLDINTWVPAGPRRFLVNVDGTLFGDRFPTIILGSPLLVIDVAQKRTKNTNVVVSGQAMACAPTCNALPSLAFPKATQKHLGIARWIDKNAGHDKICITVLNDQGVVPAPAAGTPSVQVISDTDEQAWSGATEVNVLKADGVHPLTCDPQQGSRLVCDAQDTDASKSQRESLRLQVQDPHHSGNTSIRGYVETPVCSNGAGTNPCRAPLIWKTTAPKVNADNHRWSMTIQLVNVEAGDTASLGAFASAIVCNAPGAPCQAAIEMPVARYFEISDTMSFHVSHEGDEILQSPAAIGNVLSAIKPVISQIDDKRTFWSGQNLIFDKLSVNQGPSHAIQCVNGTECHLLDSYGKKEMGYLAFTVGNRSIPFSLINAAGAVAGVFLEVPSTDAGSKPKPGNTPPATSAAESTSQASPRRRPASTYAVQ